LRNSVILVGASGLLVGFAFIYATMQRRQAQAEARAVPVASASRAAEAPAVATVSAPPPPPDQARSSQLFDRNRGMPPDPDLADEYEQLNVEFFKNILPKPSVRWETGLADLGPLIADNFSVLGLTDGTMILINPVVARDADQRRRALCHEMTHMAVWRQDQGHGPVFQDQLRHLAEMGAFKGIVATEEAKDAMLESLHRRRSDLEASEKSLKTDRDALDRTSQAAVEAFNARVETHQTAMKEYNRLVEQYNLMVSYPDGLARERLKPRADGTVR
jgi:SprT-like family